MMRSVFLKSVWEQRWGLFWWVGGIGAFNMVTLLFYPMVRNAPAINELVEQLGPMIEPFMGGIQDMTSPEGYLFSQLFSAVIPFTLIALGIFTGSRAIAGEEENGTLDLLLSNPVSRCQVVVEKFGSNLICMTVLASGIWLGLTVGAAIVSMDIRYVRLAETTAGCALLGLTFGTLAFALGCGWGKRNVAAGITAAIVVALSMLDILAGLSDGFEALRFASPFYYNNSAEVLFHGLLPVDMLVLIGLTAILLAVSVISFERRDLGTG